MTADNNSPPQGGKDDGSEAKLNATRRSVLGAAGALALPAAGRTTAAEAGDSRRKRTQRSEFSGVWVSMEFGGLDEDADLTLRNCPEFEDEPDSSGAELSMVTDVGEVTISLKPAQAEAVGRALVAAGQDGGRDE